MLLFQFNYVAPPCSGILASEVVLDGVGKDIYLSFAIFLRVLLCSQYDGLCALHTVNAVVTLSSRRSFWNCSAHRAA